MAPPIGYLDSREDAAARVAYLFSETVVSVQSSFKLASPSNFHHGLSQMTKHKTRGLVAKRGSFPNVVSVRHNADPFLTALNELNHSTFVTITTASSTLPASFSHLAKLAKFPVVIHVSMSRSFPDYAEITSLRQLGFTLIQSFSLREAQDLSIASHVLAIRTGKGVIHFFNQSNAEEALIPYEDPSALERIFDKSSLVYNPSEVSGAGSNIYWNDSVGVERTDSKSDVIEESASDAVVLNTLEPGVVDLSKIKYSTADLFQSTELVFELIRVATGRTYKAFDYHGAGNADTALLIFGSSAQDFITTIAQAGWGDIYSKIGVVTVRVYRPWSTEKLLSTVPKSVKRLGVLEQVYRQVTKWGPVLLDVISSLNTNLDKQPAIPVVVGYQLGYLDAKTIRQALRGIVQNIQSDSPIQNLVVGSSLDHADVQNSLVQPELETAYSKLLFNTFGDRLSILNALDKEDAGISKNISSNPEFGFGTYLAKEEEKAHLIKVLERSINEGSFNSQETSDLASRWLLLNNEKSEKLNATATDLIALLETDGSNAAKEILKYYSHLKDTTSWIIGSDAWSYDLGNSGVHHILASGKNVNVLIIDSQPYTERASSDADRRKKDIGLYALNYANSYVASVAVYSSYTQSLQAFLEADKFDGPSIVVAYLPYREETESPLLVLQETKKAVDSGYWPLYRWDPRSENLGLPNFQLDSQSLKKELKEFLDRENHLSQLASRLPVFSENIAGSYGSEIRAQQRRKAKESYSKLLEALSGPPLTILYASDGGNAENLSKRLARRAKARGFGAVALAMDDFPVEDLGSEENIVFIASTAGQGEFPQNGRNFWEALKSSVDLDLAGVHYAVFGLGDSLYWPRKQDKHYYNKPSKDLSTKLNALGAVSLVNIGLGDDQDPDGYQTTYPGWESELWNALGVSSVGVEVDEPPPITNEDIKTNSNFLRGTILEGLKDESTGALSASDCQLTKFHGTYMQDDRDIREERKAAGLEPAYAFMIRVRLPGGVSTPAQWLAIDELASKNGNQTFKLTTRATYQLHGVIKKNLKATMKAINVALMDTLAACGDVNRNVMCSALPKNFALHKQIHQTAKAISEHLLPSTSAYHEIWLTDENDKKTLVSGNAVVDVEPLYGPTYLPRKFKVAIAVPPYNDIDVYANDVGLIAITDIDGNLQGFNVLAGGGMGTTHNNKKTYPRTGSILGFVTTDKVVDVCEKILLVQRDHGDRKDRKHARLKYTIDDLTVAGFKEKVEERLGYKLEDSRQFHFDSNIDHFGWVKDERGLNHVTVFIENGRLEDTTELQARTGFRRIAELLTGEAEFRLTGNQHVIISNVSDEQVPDVKRVLAEYKLDNLSYSGLRLSSSACVALPTCGLAMAESERYLPVFISKVESYLEEIGLRHDSIVLRMTGCPNGCARPWLGEVALVGKALGTYNLMLGGGYHGQRLNKLYRASVNEEQALEILKPLFKRWSLEREHREHFGDFLIRTNVIKPTLEGKRFHEDIPEEE
ncbi:hypothetical protein V1514DRAFT_336847 [Lipomyces japonicus]|uniref:uncharacterized protein n=1 Tax=Lipomyces japonicus TaxID=56871 RepID=UPI0034CDAE6C